MKFDPARAIQNLHQFGEFGGVNPSITDSSTFTFLGEKEMEDTFHGEAEGYFLYSRHWNPTNKYLADALAAMEGTEEAWVNGSGMAAITTTILQICSAGDHIVSSNVIYGGSFAFLKNWLPRFNIDVTFVNPTDNEAIKKAIKPNTKMIYVETLSNPLLQVADVPAISKIAKENNAKLVVDNTFTPMIFSPKKLGADIVVYSMTKFINGKNDLVGGAICADKDFIDNIINVNDGTAMLLGPVLDPLRSSGILKNLHTLHIRMQKHSQNAAYISQKMKEVGVNTIYPGHENHPQHELFKQMMNPDFGFGGMLAIDLINAENAAKVMEKMQDKDVGYLAVSLGYFKTLFSNSGKSTSSEVPEEIQKEAGLTPGLVRFSMGLDHDIEKTWQNIKAALQETGFIK